MTGSLESPLEELDRLARSVELPLASAVRHFGERRRRQMRILTAASVVVVALAVGLSVGIIVTSSTSHHVRPGGHPSPNVTIPPPPSTATSIPSTVPSSVANQSTTTTVGIPLTSVNWNSVSYPLNCGGTPTQVLQTLYATPTPGISVGIVMVACQAGAGTPPRTVYVYEGASSTSAPNLLQTLSSDGLSRITSKVSVSGSTVSTSGGTYSSSSVPRCCPDGTFTSNWVWSSGSYKVSS